MVYISECNDMQHYLHNLSGDDMFNCNRLLSSNELRGYYKKIS